MDILITIAFLAIYYILVLGTVITLKTGLEELTGEEIEVMHE